MRIYGISDALSATGEKDRKLVGVLVATGKIDHKAIGSAKAFDHEGFLALCAAIRQYRSEHPVRPYGIRKNARRKAGV